MCQLGLKEGGVFFIGRERSSSALPGMQASLQASHLACAFRVMLVSFSKLSGGVISVRRRTLSW